MQIQGLTPIGIWDPVDIAPAFSTEDLIAITKNFREPVHILQDIESGYMGVGISGEITPIPELINNGLYLLGTLPAVYPEWLGDRSFLEVHSLRFPYVAGAMFRGIASESMVIAMAKAGMIGFFGAAGLPLERVEQALDHIQTELGESGLSWGSNLIHSPQEPELEESIVDLYLNRGVYRVSAAAFMSMTPSIVRYCATGLQRDSAGQIYRRNHVFAKLSRPEVAKMFMTPAPQDILNHLVSQNQLTQDEAELAANIPVAEDITVEADSGGHTDNRPLPALFPTILSLRDKITAHYGYARPIRVGAAGGLGTPSAVASAFAMGAAYVLTGSINQSAVESGLAPSGRKLLAAAGVADVTMAPAADMFELGVKVQVLKRGTMFCNRASQLYQIYSDNSSIDSIPADTRKRLEKDVFHAPLEEIWKDTYSFFKQRNPNEIIKAEKDPKYLMALVFRWYLGNSARWAIEGDTSHLVDFQICCGPSMGAFNAWVKGTFLENPENRTVTSIALNLLEGAAVVTRAQQLRTYGVPVPAEAFDYRPKPISLEFE